MNRNYSSEREYKFENLTIIKFKKKEVKAISVK